MDQWWLTHELLVSTQELSPLNSLVALFVLTDHFVCTSKPVHQWPNLFIEINVDKLTIKSEIKEIGWSPEL